MVLIDDSMKIDDNHTDLAPLLNLAGTLKEEAGLHTEARRLYRSQLCLLF